MTQPKLGRNKKQTNKPPKPDRKKTNKQTKLERQKAINKTQLYRKKTNKQGRQELNIAIQVENEQKTRK